MSKLNARRVQRREIVISPPACDNCVRELARTSAYTLLNGNKCTPYLVTHAAIASNKRYVINVACSAACRLDFIIPKESGGEGRHERGNLSDSARVAVRPDKSNGVKKGMNICAKEVHNDYLWSAPAGEPCRQSSKRVKGPRVG